MWYGDGVSDNYLKRTEYTAYVTAIDKVEISWWL